MSSSNHGNAAGIALALLSSATFGLIPLFTVPLLKCGMPPQMAVLCRFGLAVLLLGPILLMKGEKLTAPAVDLLKLFTLGFFYFLDVILFFHAFRYLPSGLVGTLEFLFPVMVMLIMVVFFHERFHWQSALAILLSIAGVALISNVTDADFSTGLSSQGAGGNVFLGVSLSLAAALFNALYIAGFQVVRLVGISPLRITFYVMLAGAVFAFFNVMQSGSFVLPHNFREFSLAFLLALVTAVISNLTLIMAIQRLGSTLTSILGVMEPLTAVTVGILVFAEKLTAGMFAGIFLIIIAVLIVVAAPIRAGTKQ